MANQKIWEHFRCPKDFPCCLCRYVRPPPPVTRCVLADTELFIECEKTLTTYVKRSNWWRQVIRDACPQSQVTRANVRWTQSSPMHDLWIKTLHLPSRHWLARTAAFRHRQSWQSGYASRSWISLLALGTSSHCWLKARSLRLAALTGHIHFICPQQIDEALMSASPTMLGGGTWSGHGRWQQTCTPGPWAFIARMIDPLTHFRLNSAFAAKAIAFSTRVAGGKMLLGGAAAL